MNRNREVRYTCVALASTTIALAVGLAEVGSIGAHAWRSGDWSGVVIQAIFALLVLALTYGFFAYYLTRIGEVGRIADHRAATTEELDAIFDSTADAITILVPSYKEELAVVRRTLLSAALQQYPERRVVLLIDDPPNSADPTDRNNLQAMRDLPGELRRSFASERSRYDAALRSHLERRQASVFDAGAEAAALADLYRAAARWIDALKADFVNADHGDRLFLHGVLERCSNEHRQRADQIAARARTGVLSPALALREHRRLVALFRVDFASFERKRYDNLSHAANKAMNLNSYIGLIGRNWNEMPAVGKGRQLLIETASGQGTLHVPDAAFLLTLDADSVLLPDYALRLAHLMRKPGNARMAVAQTPYSAFPGAPGELERVAGATTDIQYLIHQGFTRFGATFWVGANALLRKAALDDICTVHEERGYPIRKYIQDRTVIEDTESSIDLVDCGWSLHNYPERLAYSATPPDFGSLLIQRRRWANGGLIILPKALRYLWRGPRSWDKAAEALLRFHYLASLAIANTALVALLFGPFERNMHNVALMLASVPYMLLYTRDLGRCGYRASDFLRVFALNLLLLPVHLAGVARSLQQACTGRHTPFGRTPKVTGRTAAPAIFIVVEWGLVAASMGIAAGKALHGEWMSAAFALTYAAFGGYAAARYIGIANSVTDIRIGWLRPTDLVAEPPAAAAGTARSQDDHRDRGRQGPNPPASAVTVSPWLRSESVVPRAEQGPGDSTRTAAARTAGKRGGH